MAGQMEGRNDNEVFELELMDVEVNIMKRRKVETEFAITRRQDEDGLDEDNFKGLLKDLMKL